jgi:hypothetical protein
LDQRMDQRFRDHERKAAPEPVEREEPAAD